MAALAFRGARVSNRIRRPALQRERFLIGFQKMVETDPAARLRFDLIRAL
jgi:hypothetical protein